MHPFLLLLLLLSLFVLLLPAFVVVVYASAQWPDTRGQMLLEHCLESLPYASFSTLPYSFVPTFLVVCMQQLRGLTPVTRDCSNNVWTACNMHFFLRLTFLLLLLLLLCVCIIYGLKPHEKILLKRRLLSLQHEFHPAFVGLCTS